MKKDKKYNIQIPSEVLINSLKNTVKKINTEKGINLPLDPEKYELVQVNEKFLKQIECRFVEKETSKTIAVKIKVHT